MTRCPWAINWSIAVGQCEKDAHLPGDGKHQITVQGPHGDVAVVWLPGDRREFTGPYPGPCTLVPGCQLPAGHPPRCAP